mmetsp:Transcript_14167/g.38364  ORF Transcript_14167/g.38364 Transcript_14167/m.38364 type:complete len:220 (+) Transcript_14167:1515-2174(+)
MVPTPSLEYSSSRRPPSNRASRRCARLTPLQQAMTLEDTAEGNPLSRHTSRSFRISLCRLLASLDFIRVATAGLAKRKSVEWWENVVEWSGLPSLLCSLITSSSWSDSDSRADSGSVAGSDTAPAAGSGLATMLARTVSRSSELNVSCSVLMSMFCASLRGNHGGSCKRDTSSIWILKSLSAPSSNAAWSPTSKVLQFRTSPPAVKPRLLSSTTLPPFS